MAALQPSLRDFVNFGIGPGVETPGYYHDVPSGQRPSIGDYTILLVRLSLCPSLVADNGKLSPKCQLKRLPGSSSHLPARRTCSMRARVSPFSGSRERRRCKWNSAANQRLSRSATAADRSCQPRESFGQWKCVALRGKSDFSPRASSSGEIGLSPPEESNLRPL